MSDEDFNLEAFMARVRERQKKLEREEREIYKEVEEVDEDQDEDEDEDEASISLQENEIAKSGKINQQITYPTSELNYSSDLSLDLEPDEDPIYRAEPVVCDSSPEPTIPHQINAHCLPNVLPESPAPLQERQPEQKSDDAEATQLSIQVDQADQTRRQLKKVVELSKYGSKEHIEAARRLQLAEMKHLCFCNQLALFKQGYRKKTESLGSIKISNIRIKMSSKLRNDLAEDGFSHYFFCVGSSGSQVKETEMVATSDILKQALKTYVEFNEPLVFNDLPSDFVIKLEVFELVTGQALPKFLSRLTPSKRTKITPESCFKRIGSLKLTLAERDCNHRNLTRWSSHEESKYIDKECKFQMELKPEQLPSKFGMLHTRYMGNDNSPYWHRYFVELSDGKIKFWNTKLDAQDGKKPNEVIEFKDICSEKVQKLTPDDDLYRQNSFLFYTYQQVAGGERNNLLQRILKDDKSSKLVKHQLAADTKEERDSWCVVLDHSMFCFREWHGRTRLFKPEELKNIFSTEKE